MVAKQNLLLEETIRKVNHKAQIIECCHKPYYFVAHLKGTMCPLEMFKGKNVTILWTIASPEGLERFILNRLEANVICKRLYIDNHRFANNELEWINERSQEVDFLLTTEKDAV